MAQHLPHELLQHIISFIPPSDYLKNHVILVCSEWYDLGKYEMFWLATLKSLMQEEMYFTENEEEEYLGLPNGYFRNLIGFSKERSSYIRQLKQKEKILIFDRKPFEKRRETNSDLFGHTYWKRTRQFVTERKRRRVMLEVLQKVFQMNAGLNISEWEEIVTMLKKHNDLKSIARYNYSGLNIANLFLYHYVVDHFKTVDEKLIKFAHFMLNFLFNECETPILDCMEEIFRMKLFSVFSDESLGLFEKFKKELNLNGKKGVSDNFIVTVLQNADMGLSHDVKVVTKFATLLKNRKNSKFQETISKIGINYISCFLRETWDCIEFYMNVMEAQKYEQFSKRELFENLIRNNRGKASDFVELLRRVQNDYNLKMDFLSKYLLYQESDDILIFLIDEGGADFNELLSESDNSFLICECIYSRGLNRSNSEMILALIERGATIPNTHVFTNIFNYYCDREKFYLPTLKKLFEKYGPRFNSLEVFTEFINRSDECFSPNGLLSVFQYLVEQCSNEIFTPLVKKRIINFCKNHISKHYESNKVEEFKKILRKSYGFNM